MRSIKLSRRLLFVSCLVASHCIESGGFNQNEREAGGGDTGVSVGDGEIAIDPTGKYLLSRAPERLVYAELATGKTRTLPGLASAQRVTFAHESPSLFLTRVSADIDLRGDARLDGRDARLDAYGEAVVDFTWGELVRYDVQTGRELWVQDVELAVAWDHSGLGSVPWLDVTRDDRLLIAAYPDHVDVLDAVTGALVRSLGQGVATIIDVDLTPDQRQLVITHEHTWQGELPRTLVELYDLEDFSKVEIAVPNCSSELVISQDSRHAFVAPTRCQKDPVSAIDLERGEFVRNLPGFGPVALAADGALAVAFMDAANLDEALFDDARQIPADGARFHLMLIDTKTLRFDVVTIGDDLPRYAVAPDGKLLLVDSPNLWSDGRIRLLDVADKRLIPITGPGLELSNYVITRDSSKVFLLDRGLFTIAVAQRRAEAEPIDFTPTHLNITPDDTLLVLREDVRTLQLYGVAERKLLRSLSLE
jgi:hypothetical protein